MKLEQQLLYEPRIQERQRVYTIVDLEYLSASVLYSPSGPLGGSGPLSIAVPKIGMKLPGGLTIKKIGNNTITLNQDFGLLRDLYTIHPDGHGAKREIILGKNKLLDKKSW